MNEWMNQALTSESASVTVMVAVFLMGMFSVITCGCNFAIIGAVAGYSGASAGEGKARTGVVKGAAFLIGAIIAMAFLGAIFGYAGKLVSDTLGDYWKIAAGLLAILFGLYSMDLVPVKLPGLKIKQGGAEQNIFSAILFGLAIGGLSATLNSCCNPLFPVILAASFVKGSTVWGLLMLSVFALGYGIPLAAMIVGFELGFGRLSRTFDVIGTIAKYGGGIALVALGFYFLITF